MFKSDYHIHPLGHRYRGISPISLQNIALSEEDKACVDKVVDWCAYERKLNSIAITDHDMTAGAVYAKEYVSRKGLDIEIVIGAECELFVPGAPAGKNRAHVLCYGIEKLPRFTQATPLADFVRSAREKGTYLVMAHPVMYPHIFEEYYLLFDGYEAQSGTTPSFQHGAKALAAGQKRFTNSDFHYKGMLPSADSPSNWHNKFLKI